MKRWIGYEKGINLGGWLSQCCHEESHYAQYIREEDICKISSWGFDHVRLPIDYELLENDLGDYREEGFVIVDRLIDWCNRYNLNVVLDLHKTAGYSFDAGEKEEGFFTSAVYQERFYRLWEEIAGRYGKYHGKVAFELLNEVVDKELCHKWNKIASACIARIRKIAPETVLLVGGYWNNCVVALKDLSLPEDPNLVYNFHCYEPLVFTHQGAGWVEGMKEDFRISIDASYQEICQETEKLLPGQTDIFPREVPEGQPLNEQFFLNFFARGVKVAEEKNVALYCGEYGVIDRANPKDAAKWVEMIRKAFDYYGIGRALWNYKGLDYEITGEILEKLF